MYNDSSSPTLTNVIFSSNSASFFGGGIDNEVYSSPTLTNVTFSSNSAFTMAAAAYTRLLQFADADKRDLQQQLRRRHIQLLQFADADQRDLQQQLL